jgi:di/tricarboxylate transporter
MTLEIGLTLGILGAAVFLFISERLRMDVVALLVLILLALLGLVTPAEALSGFSNPAVVTVWAVFILSGALSRTGVANLVGRQITRVAGNSEMRLVAMIMITTAALSAFMNNVGITALFLPVVVSISRRTGIHPSRLLLPLAVSSLLGGMMTLIGTPPNLLASIALRDAGFAPLRLFDFAPLGGIITVAGIVFMLVAGRRLLPRSGSGVDTGEPLPVEIDKAYVMSERVSRIRIPAASPLSGRSLSDSRLSAALGLTVLNVRRGGDKTFIPNPGTELREGDLLTVIGRLDALEEVRGRRYLVIEEEEITTEDLVNDEIDLVGLEIPSGSRLIGGTLKQLDFRQKYGVIVLALRRADRILRSGFDNLSLLEGDVLLTQGPRDRYAELRDLPECRLVEQAALPDFELAKRLIRVRIPKESPLVGKSLAESHMAELTGLAVIGVIRGDRLQMLVSPRETVLEADDMLIVKGRARENLEALVALQELEVQPKPFSSLRELESDETGMLEVVLSPHSNYPGRTLGQIEFRGRYDLNVIAVFREGRAYRSNLSTMTLRFGDALLVHGTRDKLRLLARDSNFISLADDIQPSPRLAKAPVSVAIMLGVVLTVLLGWLPISVATVTGVLLMVLTGCMSMDEAYRDIEWRAVFLIAGMLPLGIAMQTSGTAQLLADTVLSPLGRLGDLPLIGGLFVLSLVACQVMPTAVVVVLMAPVALAAAASTGVSPYPVIMAVAVGASSSFLSPVGHPANLLIMAPGGYRFKDYIRVGLPLAFVVLLIVLLFLPVFWPLR